jgi:hypothetical protein
MRAIIALILLVSMAPRSESRTWRVNTAGTGDAPTLHAAMDSANVGDVVLAEAGEYLLESSLFVPPGVRLVGESGPAQTLLYRDEYLAPATVSLGSGAGVSGIHVRSNTYAVLFLHGAAADNCIIEALIDVSLVQGEGGPSEFRNCLFIGGEVAMAAEFYLCILMSDLGTWAVGSTLIGNDVLGFVHPEIDASSANFNFSLDPQFCGVPGSGNYFLQSTSPCAPWNHPLGASPILIGPLPVGCGAVSAKERTWGGVKALYR